MGECPNPNTQGQRERKARSLRASVHSLVVFQWSKSACEERFPADTLQIAQNVLRQSYMQLGERIWGRKTGKKELAGAG